MTQKRWAEMVKLRPKEMADLLEEFPIVYLPSGIVEWHDAHLPLGTDTLKMIEMCNRTARLTGGAVHPALYMGGGGFTHPQEELKWGGLYYSIEMISARLTALFEQLENMGAGLIVLFYGHTHSDNLIAHQVAARDFMLRGGTKARILCVNDYAPAVKHRYKVADHAAKWETSFMMGSYPDRVLFEAIPSDHGPFHGLDPREHGSASEGERIYTIVAQETAKLVEMALEASRESLADFSFPATEGCWKDCQNVRDLQTDYWQGDERWEDPWCVNCAWPSPGLIKALMEIKGHAWMARRMEIWGQGVDGTPREAAVFARLKKEWETLKG